MMQNDVTELRPGYDDCYLPSQACRMQYCSTRGGVRGWDFREVLFSGYAPDGGMFIPESLPLLSPDTLRSWKGLSYTKVVVEVASLFIPPQLIPRDHLEGELGGKIHRCMQVELIR